MGGVVNSAAVPRLDVVDVDGGGVESCAHLADGGRVESEEVSLASDALDDGSEPVPSNQARVRTTTPRDEP